MITGIIFTGAVCLAAAVGAGAHALIRHYEEAEDIKRELEAEERQQADLKRRIGQINRRTVEIAAEITRRKKHKKGGQPVTPLRRELQALTTERLRIGA